MSQVRMPWLFLKRVNAFNPLAGVKHLMTSPEAGQAQPKGEAQRERRAM